MLIELALLSGVTSYWFTYRRDLFNQNSPELLPPSRINWFNPKYFFKYLIKTALNHDSHHQLNINDDLNGLMRRKSVNNNHDLLISAGAVTIAFFASFSPLLAIFSIASVLYLSREIFQLVWLDLKMGRFSPLLVSAIMIGGMVASGYLILAALATLIGQLFVKMIARIEENSKKQLLKVFVEHPPRIWLEQNGLEILVYFSSVQVGDIVIVNAGEIIPVDGQILEGLVTVDQHVLTGDKKPVKKGTGDKVFAATSLLSGRLRIRVENAGEETIAAQLGRMLNQTQSYKDQLFNRDRKMTNALSPVELGISAVTWPLAGTEAALTVLWSGLGANMIYNSPITLLSYLHLFSHHGIFIKEGRVLELLHKIDTIVFAHINLLTLEQLTINQIHCFGEWDEKTLLTYAAAAEAGRSHPFAKAIVDKATSEDCILPTLDNVSYGVGYEIKATINGQRILVGSASFLNYEGIELSAAVQNIEAQAIEMGFSLVYVSINKQLAGILEARPTLNQNSMRMIRYLKRRGLTLYLIDPPNQEISNRLDISRYFVEIHADNKAKVVKQLRQKGRFVCFIGDGIDDAIALQSAQVAISIKGISTAGIDNAQIILMDGTLNHLAQLFQLADEFRNSMRTNFITTIIPGAICIYGTYFLHFGVPMGMGLYYTSSMAGLSNSLWPLIKYQDDI